MQETRPGSAASASGASTDRIMKLSERLQNLQKNLAVEKKSQYERLEQKLGVLKAKCMDCGEGSQRRFGVVKE